ncbi:MAG: FAD-dependent monooxygenase, partial [Thermobispora bispora]|nr:FAD-dependent monooxygenase [Thermobispora bispora]
MIDVLVAGGGPAGLATAIHAALAGMETVVVEPRPGPIDKACGEGLMPTGAAALADLGVAAPEGRPFRGIRYVDGRHRVQAEFRDGPGLGVRRTALHAALARRARDLGVRVVSGRVAEIRTVGEAVRARLTAGPEPGGPVSAGPGFDGPVPGGRRPDGPELRARWLVAADGLHSPIRARLGLGLPSGGPRRYGLRRHYRVAPWTDFVEVHWAPGGEAYVTPVADDLVGVAVLSSERRPYDEHLARFPGLLARLDGPPVTPVRGAGPLRQRVRRRVAGRGGVLGARGADVV